jgi:hypothetical protein
LDADSSRVSNPHKTGRHSQIHGVLVFRPANGVCLNLQSKYFASSLAGFFQQGKPLAYGVTLAQVD